MSSFLYGSGHVSWSKKFETFSWGLIILLSLLAVIGVAALYAAAAGNMDPWASKHLTRFIWGMGLLLVIGFTDIRVWFWMSYPLYVVGIVLLLYVEVAGHAGMGAQRWINLGFMQVQPSELMKIALVMALARYFYNLDRQEVGRLSVYIPPFILSMVPFLLVMLQPDLGTALMILVVAATIIFIAGAPYWIYLGGAALTAAAIPIAWHFVLHDYQKERVRVFLNPDADPLGAGYHITQSKIALGSGGMTGKGFLEGSQSRLNFLPEKQTDFIFTLWAEEWGFLGGAALIALCCAIITYCYAVAFRCRHAFGKFLCMGIGVNFSLYMIINIAMVTGLIPVVGAPLPLVSYGGTAMLATLISMGLVISCKIHGDSRLPKL